MKVITSPEFYFDFSEGGCEVKSYPNTDGNSTKTLGKTPTHNLPYLKLDLHQQKFCGDPGKIPGARWKF